MRLYLEPQTETKDGWIESNGIEIGKGFTKPSISWNDTPEDEVIICLIDNGMFKALAVAFSEDELKVFLEPDGRWKVWYRVKKDMAKQVAPQWNMYMKDK